MDRSKITSASHVPFMRAALEEAARAADSGNTAVAAVLRHGETIVACSGSRVETTGDPLDHAEAVVIREVAGRFGRDFLAQCILYSTMEPCPMCAWAIHLAGIHTIVLGARHAALGRRDLGTFTVESLMQLTGQSLSVISGVLEQECVAFRGTWSRRTGRLL